MTKHSQFYASHEARVMTQPRLDDAEVNSPDQDHPEGLFACSVGALSGAIMGFLFAGKISLAAGVFIALMIGLIIGWWARSTPAAPLGPSADDEAIESQSGLSTNERRSTDAIN